MSNRRYTHRRLLVAFGFVSLCGTAIAQTSEYLSSAEHRQSAAQALIDMQYADAQKCFMIAGDKVRPVLPLLVASAGLEGIHYQQVIAGIEQAIERGCDLNQADLQGLTALNLAILQGNAQLVEYLLLQGADPNQVIDNAQSEIDGLNSFTFLALLRSRAPQREQIWQHIDQLLNLESGSGVGSK